MHDMHIFLSCFSGKQSILYYVHCLDSYYIIEKNYFSEFLHTRFCSALGKVRVKCLLPCSNSLEYQTKRANYHTTRYKSRK